MEQKLAQSNTRTDIAIKSPKRFEFHFCSNMPLLQAEIRALEVQIFQATKRWNILEKPHKHLSMASWIPDILAVRCSNSDKYLQISTACIEPAPPSSSSHIKVQTHISSHYPSFQTSLQTQNTSLIALNSLKPHHSDLKHSLHSREPNPIPLGPTPTLAYPYRFGALLCL